jgi:hypothetical protein
MTYSLPYTIRHKSKRTGKIIIVPLGRRSDGATGAIDIWSEAWWVHDELCLKGTWSDGTKVTNLEASLELFDILWKEGRRVRAVFWGVATWIFGGGEARKNGMW